MKNIAIILSLIVFLSLTFFAGYSAHERIMNIVAKTFPQLFLSIEKSATMSPDVLDAHIHMGPDSLISITEGWIPYYHRHQRSYEVNEVISFLLKNDGFQKGYHHFFAMILKDYPEYIEQLTACASDFEKLERKSIDTIIQQALSFQPVNYDFPIQHDKIWGEYAVSGDTEIIQKYIRFLDAEQYESNDQVQSQVIQTLSDKSRTYQPVYRQLKILKELFTNDYGLQINKVYTYSYTNFYKPANYYYSKAYNYEKEGNETKAMKLYLQGLSCSPDYSFLYRNIGNIYSSQKKYYDALAAFRFAKWTTEDKGQPYISWQMAEVYEQLEERTEALRMYKEAYAIDPYSTHTLVRLASTYEKLGDIKNAEKHLREMVSKGKDPSPGNIEWAMRFFKRYNLSPPVIEDSMQNLLMQGRFVEIENILETSLRERKRDLNGKSILYSVYSELEPASSANVSTIEKYIYAHLEWLNFNTESHFANASLGIIYVTYAWDARGGGFSGTVTEKGWKLFAERIKLAAGYLQKAYELDPTDSVVANEMIIVAKVHPDLPDSEMEIWFKRAIQADPVGLTPYRTKFRFLAPKWGGSHEAQFAFSRNVFESAPENSMAPVLLAQAHWAIYTNGTNKNYLKRPEVWAEIKAVYTELVKRYPESMERHNWFAKTAYLAGDLKTARMEFSVIGDRWVKNVWDTHEQFERYKSLALSGR